MRRLRRSGRTQTLRKWAADVADYVTAAKLLAMLPKTRQKASTILTRKISGKVTSGPRDPSYLNPPMIGTRG